METQQASSGMISSHHRQPTAEMIHNNPLLLLWKASLLFCCCSVRGGAGAVPLIDWRWLGWGWLLLAVGCWHCWLLSVVCCVLLPHSFRHVSHKKTAKADASSLQIHEIDRRRLSITHTVATHGRAGLKTHLVPYLEEFGLTHKNQNPGTIEISLFSCPNMMT